MTVDADGVITATSTESVRVGMLAKDAQAMAEEPVMSKALAKCCVLLAVEAATQSGAIPPHTASPDEIQEVAEALAAHAEAATAPAARTEGKHTPLHLAAVGQASQLVQMLMDAGATMEGGLMGEPGGTPLTFALFYAATETAELLAASMSDDELSLREAAGLGRDVESYDVGRAVARARCGFYRPIEAFPEWARTYEAAELVGEALAWAARNGQVKAMAELVKVHDADVDATVYRGTPLLWAVYADNAAAAEWLIAAGADVDRVHDFGGREHGQQATALHLAGQFGAVKCLQVLLAAGADATIKDGGFGATALGWAEHCGNEEGMAALRGRE